MWQGDSPDRRRGGGWRGGHSAPTNRLNSGSPRSRNSSNPNDRNYPLIKPSPATSNPAFNGSYDSLRDTGASSPTRPLSTPSQFDSYDLSPRHHQGHQDYKNYQNYRVSARRAYIRDLQLPWAYQQESKIKVYGIPKNCWIKDVYQSLAQFGNIVRIEVKLASRVDNEAFVSFVPPSRVNIEDLHVCIGNTRVHVQTMSPYVSKVKSPLDVSRVYHERNILYANSIDFGVKVADKSMVIMRAIEAKSEIQVALNLKRKELDLQLPVHIDGMRRKCRIELPFALLPNIYKLTKNGSQHVILVIPFESSPRFYMQAEDVVESMGNTKDRTWSEWNSWYRQTDVTDQEMSKRLVGKPLMSHKDGVIIDIGRWTNYRLCFDVESLNGQQFDEFIEALSDYGVSIIDIPEYTVKDRINSPLRTLLQDEISGTHPHLGTSLHESAFDELLTSQINLSFPVRYQLDVCISNGYVRENNVTQEFLEQLSSIDTSWAVHILEKVVEKQDIHYDPMKIFSQPSKGLLTRSVPNYCIVSRSVNITPTMIHVASPVVEMSNRIIRKHAADADRFLRVRFSDEKTEGRIRGQRDGKNQALFERIRHAMTHGIVVAGRYYQFLAFGNSQFRENGAYFYAPTSSKSADDIRLSLGHFSHIKTVAKFGSRIGQCFSTTRALTINVRIEKIPDIERNGFNFSDGVGKLSLFLAQMAARELGLPNPFDDPPSLYQFRLAGCKGVLALDPTLTGSVVHIRPSQLKFEAPHTGLEVIRASSLATAYFNRQIILVLSTLGVPDKVFIQKQQENIDSYELATEDEDVALRILQNRIDMHQTSLTMASMVLDGFMKSREPFMMSLLHLWRAFNIKGLKEKARVAIDHGAFVLGCVDETATLRGHYDSPQSLDARREEKLATLPEIFLKITDTARKGHYKVIEGICILARNPSLHPGDIRVVRAVDVPALHHLKNVVVLPQTGDRDIANMCSGGDLDGDDYMVLWDKDLIPAVINEPPMDFTPEKPVEVDKPITTKDMIEFFVAYIQNDSLGQIAHAHLAQADFNEEGVKDEKCLSLAILHSRAVDYPKSGIPAIMDASLRPLKWPHFMERKFTSEKDKYKSKKVLGKMFDQVQFVDFKPQYGNEKGFDGRILNAYILSDAVLDSAAEIKVEYDSALKRLMVKNDIQTEFEAWSIFVLAHNEGRDYKFAEEFGSTMEALKTQFRSTCRKAAGVAMEADYHRLPPFVAAMYTVTAREMTSAIKECQQKVPLRTMTPESMPFMSFPWLFASELGRIATGKIRSRPSAPISQSLPHKSKKRPEDLQTPGTGLVETEEGITRPGELLKLDFGHTLDLSQEATKNRPARGHALVKSSPMLPFPAHMTISEDNGEAIIYEEPAEPGSDLNKALPNTDKESEGAVTCKETADTGNAMSNPASPSNADNGREGSDQVEIDSEKTSPRESKSPEINVDFNKKKPSALDKLRLLC